MVIAISLILKLRDTLKASPSKDSRLSDSDKHFVQKTAVETFKKIEFRRSEFQRYPVPS